MRSMAKRKRDRRERGAVTIIEAAFVFPITFFVVLFMIMAGEAYFEHAVVEYYVTSAAVDGAARCENPMLSHVLSGGSVPTDPTTADVMPYRYIFTGEAQNIAGEIEGDLERKIEKISPLLFKDMKPEDVSVTVTPKMNPLISHLTIDCEFTVPLPIRFIFSDEDMGFSYTVTANASVGDPAEFIRNVSVVTDFLERSSAFTEFCGKVKECMQKIGAYIG